MQVYNKNQTNQNAELRIGDKKVGVKTDDIGQHSIQPTNNQPMMQLTKK